MRDEPRRIDAACGEHAQQYRGAGRVGQAGGDRDVADPMVFQVQRGGFAVHADVGDVTADPD